MPKVPLVDAIRQLKNELRDAVLERGDEDIVFTPNGVELELGVTFSTEEKVGGGFKLFALLDLSVEGAAKQESQHKIKLSLSVADKKGQPIKIRSEKLRKGLPNKG